MWRCGGWDKRRKGEGGGGGHVENLIKCLKVIYQRGGQSLPFSVPEDVVDDDGGGVLECLLGGLVPVVRLVRVDAAEDEEEDRSTERD